MPFRDRAEAGRRLAERLAARRLESPIVFGLPRGGVPVAAEVADALGAPLDVFVARKLGLPGHEELGIGAIAEGLDTPVVSETARQFGLDLTDMAALAALAHDELRRRVRLYRGARPLRDVTDRTVVLVDDGLATGVTAEAALRSLRLMHPAHIVLAIPVCARDTANRLSAIADEVVSVEAPLQFVAVGQWYRDFRQTTDDEVLESLARNRSALKSGGRAPTG